MMPLALLLGLTLGTGIALTFVAVLPAAPLDLPAALAQITGRPGRTDARTVPARLARRAARARHPWLGLPEADLDLLEIAPQQYLSRRLRGAVLGAAGGTGLGFLGMAGNMVPAVVVAFGTVAGAGLGGMFPYFQLCDSAARRREEYRRVLAVYLDLVAQERSAGRAATPALRESAELSEHPLFLRIRATVAHAHRFSHTPWDALRNLGDRIQLPELVDVADLADTAADGAAIATSLHTQATSLRHAALATDSTDANARSERLTLPTSLLMLAVLGLVLYPTLALLLTT